MSASSPFHYSEGVLTLSLHVQPGAARTAPAGKYGESALKLKISAPARDGKANRACQKFFSDLLGIPLARVTLIRGAGSRDKVIRIDSLNHEEMRKIVELWELD